MGTKTLQTSRTNNNYDLARNMNGNYWGGAVAAKNQFSDNDK
jgi:hypothetical protein